MSSLSLLLPSLTPAPMANPTVTRHPINGTDPRLVDAQVALVVSLVTTVISPITFLVEVGVPKSFFVLDSSQPVCSYEGPGLSIPVTCSIYSTTASAFIIQLTVTCPSNSVCSASVPLSYKISGFRNIRYEPTSQVTKLTIATAVSAESRIAEIVEAGVTITPSLSKATIPTPSIIPSYVNNRTGSVTSLHLPFQVPSLVHAGDKL